MPDLRPTCRSAQNLNRLIGLCLINFAVILSAAGVSPPQTPEAESGSFRIAAGFSVRLFASEPMVQDPVMMTFDEDGRLWVVEMRGFMHDLTARSEALPLGRISVLEDTDGDGRADKSTVFLDKLVMPRSVAMAKGGVLVADQKQLVFARDRDGDLKADTVELVDPDFGSGGNPEHSPNGLFRAMDNWIYNAKSDARYRLVSGKWRKDPTEMRGQYGICQDDYGRLVYNYNWSQLHADLVPPNLLNRNPHHIATSGINTQLTTDQSVHPVRPTPAINRGYVEGAFDDQGRAREFTSACSPLVYRGAQFAARFGGAAFVCEPALNLVKCSLLSENADTVSMTAKPLFDDREFMASTDERFRPVWIAGGPDGALYVADMYRGAIQHVQYMTAYLREQVKQRDLEGPVNLGRIWRIIPDTAAPRSTRPLSRLGAAELVGCLADPNGWVRDTAQRLLVERGDVSIQESLVGMALDHPSPLARIHALWTLEGLGCHNDERLVKARDDEHPKVRIAALLVTVCGNDRTEGVQPRVLACLTDESAEVRVHAALSIRGKEPGGVAALASAAMRDSELPVMRDAIVSSIAGVEAAFLRAFWKMIEASGQLPSLGKVMLSESAAAAAMRAGGGAELLALLAAHDGGWGQVHRAILAAIGVHGRDPRRDPVRLNHEPVVLTKIANRPEAEFRRYDDLIRQVFAWPGHEPAKPHPSTTRPLSESEQRRFADGRQLFLTTCAVCHGLNGEGMNALGPPLQNSEWVLGDLERLVRIVVHGLEGPIAVNGEIFGPPRTLPAMPPVNGLTSEQLAAILTYIRRDWDHLADPVSEKQVSTIRLNNQGRQKPWTEEELRSGRH